MSTQEYIQKVVEDVGEDGDFKSGSWVSANNYVNTNGGTVTRCLRDIKNLLKNRKLDQVVAIVKHCSPNTIGDLIVTMKDITGTIPGTIHYKVISEGGYGKDITTKPLDEDDDVVVLENSETKEEDFKEDESDHNKERYTFEDDDDGGEFDDLD
uniref:Homologous recombination OB-fold protein OB-fold domain-containing protein n=1 Tax=Tanacetum cinerariifolium TaxID=118510 RepID=A0A699HUU6_TANCI|nr:hypothetical protein [Tanacetum cinerariifolium]